MNYLKITGYCVAGVTVGVAAVALAPFTGGGSVLGAATLASSLLGAEAIAVGAAVVGGAAGAAVSLADDAATEQRSKNDVQQGRNEERARNSAKMEAFQRKIDELIAQIANREQFIVVAFGLGIACASSKNKLTNIVMDELDWLICGIGTRTKLSSITQNKISEMRSNPPSINSAWALIRKHGFTSSEYNEIFSIIINFVEDFCEENSRNASGF